MEQLATFIFGIIGGIALLIAVALYIRYRRCRRITAWKNRVLLDRSIENVRLEKELKQTLIEKQLLEKLVIDKLKGKEDNDSNH